MGILFVYIDVYGTCTKYMYVTGQSIKQTERTSVCLPTYIHTQATSGSSWRPRVVHKAADPKCYLIRLRFAGQSTTLRSLITKGPSPVVAGDVARVITSRETFFCFDLTVVPAKASQ